MNVHHSTNLNSSKSAIVCSPHIIYLTILKNSEREGEIRRENFLLLDKMTRIMSTPQNDFIAEGPPLPGRSLNVEARRRRMLHIMAENEAILKRIQTKAPTIDAQTLDAEHQKHIRLLNRLRKFPHLGGTRLSKYNFNSSTLFCLNCFQNSIA